MDNLDEESFDFVAKHLVEEHKRKVKLYGIESDHHEAFLIMLIATKLERAFEDGYNQGLNKRKEGK